MKKQIALLVLFFFVVLQGCKKDDVQPDYSDKYVGTWTGIRMTMNGQTINIKGVSSVSLTNTFTKTETNKVKMNMIGFVNGQTTVVNMPDSFEIKNIDTNTYDLIIPTNVNSGGSMYVTLNVNTRELKVGGFASGNAFEYVFTK